MSQYKEEHFTISLPGDLCETMEDLATYAIDQAREEAETYVIPCQWEARHTGGELGDWEVTFDVVRYSR